MGWGSYDTSLYKRYYWMGSGSFFFAFLTIMTPGTTVSLSFIYVTWTGDCWAKMLNDGDCGQEVSTRATTTGLCHPRCGIHHTLFQGFSSSTSFLHKVFSFWAFCFELQWLVDNETELLHRKIYIFRVNVNFSTHSKLSGSLLCVIQHKIHSVRW